MKILRILLGSIYLFLIILLLLINSKSCNHATPTPLSQNNKPELPLDTTNIVRQAEKTGKSGMLKVTLLWNFQGDIDLHMKQPNGNEIYYKQKKDESTGGFLDVDNRNGGNGSAENIYWENPEKGKYSISLVYYQESQSSGLAESGVCTIVVFQQGKEPCTYEVNMSQVKETKNVININVI